MSPNSNHSLGKSIACTLLGLFSMLYFGCSSSQLTRMWKDPEFNNSPLKNILVVVAKNNPIYRRLWEDEFSNGLSAYGETAVCSYKLFPDSIPTPSQVSEAVQDRKFDGVLFLRRLPTEITTKYVPGLVHSEKVTQYEPRSQTYSTFYRDIRQPGFIDTTKVIRHEALVFTTKGEGGHIIWGGTGEMINPSSMEEVRNEVTSLIIPELSHEGIVPTKQ